MTYEAVQWRRGLGGNFGSFKFFKNCLKQQNILCTLAHVVTYFRLDKNSALSFCTNYMYYSLNTMRLWSHESQKTIKFTFTFTWNPYPHWSHLWCLLWKSQQWLENITSHYMLVYLVPLYHLPVKIEDVYKRRSGMLAFEDKDTHCKMKELNNFKVSAIEASA